MKHSLLFLLLLLTTAGTQVPARQPKGPTRSDWGPTWIGGKPTGGAKRPAKLKRDLVYTSATCVAPAAVEVRMWGDVATLKKGEQYQLLYQYRLHTKKGERGRTLGSREQPEGIAFPLVTATYDGDLGKWYGMEEVEDVTRKELSGMTNLPELKAGSRTVFLRVEPHLYNATKKKYLTPPKTPAIIVVATVWPNRRVMDVRLFGSWIREMGKEDAGKVAEVLADLDDYDPLGSDVGGAVAFVLRQKHVPTPTKVKLIENVPKETIAGRVGSIDLVETLHEYAKGREAKLRAAAQKKLGEVE